MEVHVTQARTAAERLWYKDAIIYQLHVKSFFDSNNDGIGDFPGLISKLDYIADLGVNVAWDGNIDQDQRPIAPGLHYRLHILPVQYCFWTTG